MDKQKQIEEMAQDIACGCVDLVGSGCGDTPCYVCIARKLKDKNYRKIPENAVVLTREDMSKYAKDCIAGEETGLDIINALIARAERYKEQAKQARKETAEKFAERLKFKLENYVRKIMREDYQQGAYIYMIESSDIEHCIDEICKEITEGKV